MRYRCSALRNSALMVQFFLLISLLTPRTIAAEDAGSPAIIEGKLQSLVNDLKSRLAIGVPIVVQVVPTNALMMSVEAPEDPTKAFALAVDASFLNTLTDDELEAALAHELGHVWIFTHHPYLQTEELANQIAMRAVTRASLERVYAKVWERGGTKGDLVRFLGSPSKDAGLAPAASAR
jgi:peptidase M48-like protein